jgi:hypothetical protein
MESAGWWIQLGVEGWNLGFVGEDCCQTKPPRSTAKGVNRLLLMLSVSGVRTPSRACNEMHRMIPVGQGPRTPEIEGRTQRASSALRRWSMSAVVYWQAITMLRSGIYSLSLYGPCNSCVRHQSIAHCDLMFCKQMMESLGGMGINELTAKLSKCVYISP